METAVITTWLAGNCSKGTLCVLYVFAWLKDGQFAHSDYKYSTAEGARRAARKRGFKVQRYVAQGHDSAKRRLISDAQLARAPDYNEELAGIISVADRI